MKAEYIDHMGDDLRVVNAARVSFDKESFWSNEEDWLEFDADPQLLLFDADPQLLLTDQKLISYLAKHDHFSPFTHPQITLRETVPIFVARQRFKHTVGFTYNEVSRRYVDDTPEFYVPEVWRKRPEGSVKQGSSDEAVIYLCADEDGEQERPLPEGFEGSGMVSEAYERLMYYAGDLYAEMIASGVCPEQARMVLPQSMMTSYYVTGSLMAFARAYKLRADGHAQKEIRDLAAQWGQIIRPLFPVSWSALCD